MAVLAQLSRLPVLTRLLLSLVLLMLVATVFTIPASLHQGYVASSFEGAYFPIVHLFSAPAEKRAVLAVLLQCMAAALIGQEFFISVFFRSASVPLIIRFVAGFLPGMASIVVIARATTLFLPNAAAPGVIGILVLLLAGLALVLGLKNGSFRDASRRWITPGGLTAALCVIALVAIIQIEAGQSHVTGDATGFWVSFLYLDPHLGVGGSGHLPIISQHYDEAAFLYAGIYGLLHSGPKLLVTITTLYWVMMVAAKASCLALLFLSLRTLGLNVRDSVLAIALVFFTALSLNPFGAYLLFDSGNPSIMVPHAGRLVAPYIALWFLAAMLDKSLWKVSSLTWPALVILGAGLSAMTINIALLLPWTAVAALVLSEAEKGEGVADLQGKALWLVLLCVASVVAAYLPLPPVLRLGFLFLGSMACAGILLRFALRGGLRGAVSWRGFGMLCALGGGYAVGLLFFGNATVHLIDHVLGVASPFKDLVILNRAIGASEPYHGPMIALTQNCVKALPALTTALGGQCSSFPLFARSYGLFFVLMSFAVLLLVRLPREKISPLLLVAPLCLAVAVMLSLLLLDFIPAASWLAVWVRTRLVEQWFYPGLLVGVIILLRYGQGRVPQWTRGAICFCVALFIFNPLLIPAQLITNFAESVVNLYAGEQ